MLHFCSISFFISRSTCLTKNYCSTECASADKAAHKHCCEDDPLGSDPRKWKLEREDQANQLLKDLKQNLQETFHEAKNEAIVSEVMSKFKELEVKEKPEVD